MGLFWGRYNVLHLGNTIRFTCYFTSVWSRTSILEYQVHIQSKLWNCKTYSHGYNFTNCNQCLHICTCIINISVYIMRVSILWFVFIAFTKIPKIKPLGKLMTLQVCFISTMCSICSLWWVSANLSLWLTKLIVGWWKL